MSTLRVLGVGFLLGWPCFLFALTEQRQQTFDAFVEHGEAHLGGSFSIIETLLTLCYIY